MRSETDIRERLEGLQEQYSVLKMSIATQRAGVMMGGRVDEHTHDAQQVRLYLLGTAMITLEWVLNQREAPPAELLDLMAILDRVGPRS